MTSTMTSPDKMKTPAPKHTYGKLLALCAFSCVLSTFGPFILFAPAATALAFIYYGARKALPSFAVMMVLLFVFGMKASLGQSSCGIFALTILEGYFIYKIIAMKKFPSFGLLYSGSLVLLILVGLLTVATVLFDFSLVGLIEHQINTFVGQVKQTQEYSNMLAAGGEQARLLKMMISNPEEMTKEVVSWLPSIVFISVFLSLWASFYFVLRNSLFWRLKVDYPYGLVHFTNFKLPFALVYPLILALVLVLFGDQFGSEWYGVVGFNILYCLGTLYFFQGFGVFYDYLRSKNLVGFGKSVILMLVLVFAWRMLVFVGLLDLWVNFRKFYVKKEIEGEG